MLLCRGRSHALQHLIHLYEDQHLSSSTYSANQRYGEKKHCLAQATQKHTCHSARGSTKLDPPHLPNKLNFSFDSHAPRPPNHAMLMDALVGAIQLDFWILELGVQLCISGVGGRTSPTEEN